jgi:hypothetical protein
MAESHEHGPTVTNALSRIIDRATSNLSELRRDELVLYTVAEFWAAARAHELASHLKTDAASRLQAAGVAFTEMGAPHVAGTLRHALHRIRESSGSRKQVREIVRDLESELIETDDPVELLLAALAARYISGAGHARGAGN